MNFNLKICLIIFLFYKSLIIIVQSLDVNDNSDEVEIYKHLFAKLNKVIDGIDLVQQNMELLENRMKSLEIKLDQTATMITPTLSNIECLVEKPNSSSVSSELYCFNKNWNLIQINTDGSKKLYRDWKDVEAAVDNKSNDFLARLGKLYRLTISKPEENSTEDDGYIDLYDLIEF